MASSSRRAGAITRTSEDAWRLAWRNLLARRRSLKRASPASVRGPRSRSATSRGRPAATRRRQGTSTSGGGSRSFWRASRWSRTGSSAVEPPPGAAAAGSRARHHLVAPRLDERRRRERWEEERPFVTADGEAGQLVGNLTTRWQPDGRCSELRLPHLLDALASRPKGRCRLVVPGRLPLPRRRGRRAGRGRPRALRHRPRRRAPALVARGLTEVAGGVTEVARGVTER